MLWADHALLGERRRSLIRKVAATELVSVDCVMEAPEEWTLSSSNQVSEAANPSNMATSDALLLAILSTDELRLIVHPLVLRSGRRLLGDGLSEGTEGGGFEDVRHGRRFTHLPAGGQGCRKSGPKNTRDAVLKSNIKRSGG